MFIHAIASHEALQNTLRETLLQSGLSLTTSKVRGPDQGLQPWIEHTLHEAAAGDVLLIDIPLKTSKDDLSALQTWLSTRPDLHVMALCEDNTPSFLLQAMRSGVREVLALPLNPQEILEGIARGATRAGLQTIRPALTPLPPQAVLALPPQGKLMAFMATKGGNGSSFIAANIGHILATEFDRSCAFVDMDLQCGDASFYLSSGSHTNSLFDLTRQIDRLDVQLLASCMHAVTPRLGLLAAPHEMESALTMTARDIEKVLNIVQSQYEQILVDLPRTLNILSLKVLDMADVIFIVTQCNTPDVRDVQRLVSTLRALGYSDHKLRLLVNQHTKGAWVSVAELEKAAGLKVTHTLPSNPQWVNEALHTGKPLAAVHDHNGVMHALREMAGALLDTSPNKNRHWLQRWMGQRA
jgi:pilus assembly protein CpaE